VKAYTSSCHKAIAVHRDAQGPGVRAVIAHWFDGPGEHDSVFAGLNLFQSGLRGTTKNRTFCIMNSQDGNEL
jgi:hypothetical protein